MALSNITVGKSAKLRVIVFRDWNEVIVIVGENAGQSLSTSKIGTYTDEFDLLFRLCCLRDSPTALEFAYSNDVAMSRRTGIIATVPAMDER